MPKRRRHLDEPVYLNANNIPINSFNEDGSIYSPPYKRASLGKGRLSEILMTLGHKIVLNDDDSFYNNLIKGGPIQASYLMSRKNQNEYLLNHGYIKGKTKDYGLVTKAVNGRDLPVYQTHNDVIDRKYLVPYYNSEGWNDEGELIHAGSYPKAHYIDGRNPLQTYKKAWDLNDYSGNGFGSYGYTKLGKLTANILDRIGNPVVQTSGYVKDDDFPFYINMNNRTGEVLASDKDKENYIKETYNKGDNRTKAFLDFLNSKGLQVSYLNGEPLITLKPVNITDNYINLYAKGGMIPDQYTPIFKNGGSIHIKPENRGKFTALKERTGHSATWFKNNGTPAQKKMAVFALNSRKWKH